MPLGFSSLGIIIVNVFGSNEGMSFITGEGDMPDPDKRASLFPRRGQYQRPYGEGRAPNIESRLVPPGGGDAIESDGVSGEDSTESLVALAETEALLDVFTAGNFSQMMARRVEAP